MSKRASKGRKRSSGGKRVSRGRKKSPQALRKADIAHLTKAIQLIREAGNELYQTLFYPIRIMNMLDEVSDRLGDVRVALKKGARVERIPFVTARADLYER